MTKEQIEKLFVASRNNNIEEMFNLIEDKELRENISQIFNTSDDMEEMKQASIQFNQAILKQINESGEYDYLEELGMQPDNQRDFINIIQDTVLPLETAKKYLEYFTDEKDKVKIIKATRNAEFIKQYIENNSIEILGKLDLIKATKDSEYMMKFINDESIDFWFKVELAKEIGDIELIQEYLKDEYLNETSKVDLVIATKEIGFIKQYLKDNLLNLNKQSKERLIIAVNDEKYTDQCIRDQDLNLDENTKINLIKRTKNIDYIKKCIEDKTLDLSNTSKIELMQQKCDKKYIKYFLENNESDLNEDEQIILHVIGNDEKYIEEQFAPKQVSRLIDLPQSMTIGVEIESEGKFSSCLSNGNILDWKTKNDSSLDSGVEVVSPVLTGSEEDTKNLYTVCNVLKRLGQETSDRCGGHIHIGADYLKSKDAYANLIALWGNTEKILYEICNDKGELTRKQAIEDFAEPISGKVEKAITDGSINLTTEEELEDFVNQLKIVQGNRYSGINFLNVDDKMKNTIEFRLPNGTLEPEVWVDNINLFGGIIRASEELAQIQQKPEEDRTEVENEKINLFNIVSSQDVEEKEKLNALLRISVSDEKRKIYEERYEINSELVQNDSSLDDAIKQKTSKKPILPKKIGKKVLTGEEPVTGQEMNEATNRLALDRDRQQGITR